MNKTIDNLKTAFAGESQAYRKYRTFSNKAKYEGYLNAAKLFKAAAIAEKIHAVSQLKILGLVNSTKENLQASIKGETFEYTDMYPEFIKEAKAEKNTAAELAFDYAMDAEKVHAKLYQDALKNLEDKTDKVYFVCPVCGFIEEGDQYNHPVHDRCPVCKTMKSAFIEVSEA